ncbi:hypothetical protein F5Y05DRAFT_272393 [Hypoxylon sp. FL0543]|nr:hypothetical protein F5Y05DRAFT_272393 [Hypoxylon sp. FL0543]
MEPQGPAFPLFPRLPTELRLAVWRECLPHRVVELQLPHSDVAFTYQRGQGQLEPCKLELATYKNNRPPVISRVCRESRAVAFETVGRLGRDPDEASDNHWDHRFAVREPWLDTARDVIHLHYDESWDLDYAKPTSGNPMRYAVWVASRTKSNQVSVNLMLLLRPGSLWGDIIGLLRLRSSWLVVVYVVVVHMDLEVALATGLFGLLGDAPVQIVDLRDQARIDAFNKLALTSEQRKPSAGQAIDKDSLRGEVVSLEYMIRVTFMGQREPPPAMYPAVMYRLCTETCYQPRQGSGKNS